METETPDYYNYRALAVTPKWLPISEIIAYDIIKRYASEADSRYLFSDHGVILVVGVVCIAEPS